MVLVARTVVPVRAIDGFVFFWGENVLRFPPFFWRAFMDVFGSCDIGFRSLQKVTLKLGNACNMRCRHCSQSNDKDIVLSGTVSDGVLAFLDSYVRFAVDRTFSEGKSRYLIFYGGEPLLYWETVKRIVVGFTERYGLLDQDLFRFVVTTNGLLLDDEKVAFINRYRIRVKFSYDAPHPFAVRGYVSDEVCALVNRIDDCVILSGGSAFNCDPLLAHKCLSAKFPRAKQSIRLGVSRMFASMPDDIDDYDCNVLRESIHKLFVAAKLDDRFAVDYIRMQLERVFSKHMYDRLGVGVGICTPAFIRLTVDLQGNVFFCSNSCIRVGSVSEPLRLLYGKGLGYWTVSFRALCGRCPHNDVCADICCLSERNAEGLAFDCVKFRIPFWGIFKEELSHVGEPLSSADIDWYRAREKDMDEAVGRFLSAGGMYGKGNVSV